MGKLRTRDIEPKTGSTEVQALSSLSFDEIVDAIARQYERDLAGLIDTTFSASDVRDFVKNLARGKKEKLPTENPSLYRDNAHPIVEAIVNLVNRRNNGGDLSVTEFIRLNDAGLLPLVGLLSNPNSAQIIIDECNTRETDDTGVVWSKEELFETAGSQQDKDSDERALLVGEIQPSRGQTIAAMFELGSATLRYKGVNLSPTADFFKQLRRLDRWNEVGHSHIATR